eukprot:3425881-Rhodomonas_salina.2
MKTTYGNARERGNGIRKRQLAAVCAGVCPSPQGLSECALSPTFSSWLCGGKKQKKLPRACRVECWWERCPNSNQPCPSRGATEQECDARQLEPRSMKPPEEPTLVQGLPPFMLAPSHESA